MQAKPGHNYITMQNNDKKNINRLKNSELFQANWQAKKAEKLAKRFGHKSWCERHSLLKGMAYSFSFLINVISIIGAFYGTYWAFQFMGGSPYVSAALAALLLVLLEVAKRHSSDEVWDQYWSLRQVNMGWVGLSVILFIISAALSGFGIWQGTQDFAPQANIIRNDSTLTMLSKELANSERTIEALGNNKNEQGVVFYHSQRAIKEFATQQNALLGALLKKQNEIDQLNNTATQQQQMTVQRAATIALLLYLMLEVLFECCMSFCSHYDFRDYLEEAGITAAQFQNVDFRNSSEFKNLINNYPHNSYNSIPYQENGIGFSAIANRMWKNNSLNHPHPSEETRGSRVYTQFHSSTPNEENPAEKKQIRIVEEVVEDAEKAIEELCGKIQKFYPSRWNKVAERNGTLTTMATNFHRFLAEIEDIKKENPTMKLSQKWRDRVAEYHTIFKTTITPHIPKSHD